MVSINKKDIDLFEYDTNSSFIERVCSKFKILPEWIGIKTIDLEKIKKEKDITIPFLVDELKEYRYDQETFLEFITKLKDQYNISIDTLLKLFFYYVEIDDFDLITIRELIKKTNVIFKGLFDKKIDDFKKEKKDIDKEIEKKIDDFIKNKDEFKKEIDKKIEIYRQQSNKLNSIYKTLDSIKIIDYNININKETSKIRLTTNIKNDAYSLSSIFANLICFNTTPFMSYLTESNE